MSQVTQAVTLEQLTGMQQLVDETHVSEEIGRYVVALVGQTRSSDLLLRGGSPRATLAVTAMAKAVARLRGRDYVVPKDVQEVLPVTVAHRLKLSPKADSQDMDAQQVLKTILSKVRAPKLR